MVTNCSKERPGSIVNETLKNGISMLKDISKESDFYTDIKYISLIKFSLCHQKLRAWENLPYFGKKGVTPPRGHRIVTKITPSHSRYQRNMKKKFQSPIYKNVGFRIFCQMTNHGCVFFFFFPRGHRIDQVVLECCKRAYFNGNEKF